MTYFSREKHKASIASRQKGIAIFLIFAALISRVANSEDVCGSGASDATAWTLVLSEDGSNCLDVSMSGVPRTEDEVTSPEWCETVDRPIIAYKRITNTNA